MGMVAAVELLMLILILMKLVEVISYIIWRTFCS